MKIDPNRAGLALGTSFAIYHFIWVILVFLGLGRAIVNLYLVNHFMRLNIDFVGFSLVRGIYGVVLAFIVGYGVGYIFGFVWERLK